MFTTGQILGLIAFVGVVLLLAAALKWLERLISPPAAETVEAVEAALHAAPEPTVKVRHRSGRAKRRKK